MQCKAFSARRAGLRSIHRNKMRLDSPTDLMTPSLYIHLSRTSSARLSLHPPRPPPNFELGRADLFMRENIRWLDGLAGRGLLPPNPFVTAGLWPWLM